MLIKLVIKSIVVFLHRMVLDIKSLVNTLHACAGYLSDSPHEFLVELLEFVASLAEQGTPPLRVLQTNLPNLFGPVFGIRSHAVSCKLLEYGYLAVCSQHQ